MARYIDADALKEKIEKLKYGTDDIFGMGIQRGIERVETAVDMTPTADVVEKDNFTIENMTKVTLDIENKLSELKEKIKQHKSIVDIDDKTLFQYHKEVEQLANEISNELLRREP